MPHRETMRLSSKPWVLRDLLLDGGGLSNTLTNLCMALYCHENSVQKYKNNEQRNTMRKLNKAMHKFVGVLDKYGLGRVGGGGGWGRTSLVWIEEWSFPILRSRPCSSARLVFTYVAISSSLVLLFQSHVAKKCVIIGCTYGWSSSVILGIELINNYSSSLNGVLVNSPWGWRPNRLLTQRPWGREE